MSIELSERMQAVANLVSKGTTVADVGCDHGYVAIWLVKSKVCPRVIAMDVNKGPLERAASNIRLYGLTDYIETRLSNGTMALQKGEVDAIVCAGMGGKLMMQILTEGMEKVKEMQELILQPQSELREMRCFLRSHGMRIIAEDMVRDEEKFYPMMKVQVHARSTDERCLSDREQRMEDTYGPVLLQRSHPVLEQFLQKRLEICATILEQLSEGQKTERQIARIEEIEQEMRDIDLVLKQYFIR